MAAQGSDHSRFRSSERGKYPIPEDRMHMLRSDEVDLLEKDGHWLEALAQGKIKPENKAQKRFVDVVERRKEPKAKHEWAWVKIFPTYKRKKSDTRRKKRSPWSGQLPSGLDDDTTRGEEGFPSGRGHKPHWSGETDEDRTADWQDFGD